MKKQKELLIIMPAYNEEKNIEAVLYELEKPEISSIADILVMNDASSDSTNFIWHHRLWNLWKKKLLWILRSS